MRASRVAKVSVFFKMQKQYKIDLEDLAAKTGLPLKFLRWQAATVQNSYRVYTIPKRNGKMRIIEAPSTRLKLIQARLVDRVLPKKVSSCATAFVHQKSIADNARPHLNKPVVLGMDIKNFFPSLGYKLLLRYLVKNGFSPAAAKTVTALCTFDGHLPQGAVTSPHLANLLLYEFDLEIRRYVRRFAVYTRYADDLTFSGNLNEKEIADIIRKCRAELKMLNLKLNPKKTHVSRRGARQQITGLVVNEKLHAPRELRRDLRQEMYYLNKFWETEHQKITEERLDSLLGKINFVWNIDRDNAEFFEYRRQLLEIKKFSKNSIVCQG